MNGNVSSLPLDEDDTVPLKRWVGERVLAIGAVAALSIFLFGPIDDLTPIGQLIFSLACGAALIGLLRYVSAAV